MIEDWSGGDLPYSRCHESDPANSAGRPEAGTSATLHLIAALKPFAAIRADDGDDFSKWSPEVIVRCEVSVGEIHAARAAIASVGRSGNRQDRADGLGPKDEHAVAATSGETPKA